MMKLMTIIQDTPQMLPSPIVCSSGPGGAARSVPPVIR
jgi:hypothetical protein